MEIILVPQIPVPERAIETALKNIVEGIAELLEEESGTLVNEWAEAAGIENPNIFMKEKAARILAAKLYTFFDTVIPDPHQFTAEHVAAFSTPLFPPHSSERPELSK